MKKCQIFISFFYHGSFFGVIIIVGYRLNKYKINKTKSFIELYRILLFEKAKKKCYSMFMWEVNYITKNSKY